VPPDSLTQLIYQQDWYKETEQAIKQRMLEANLIKPNKSYQLVT